MQSGLLAQRDNGEVVDRFRNRLMVPICRETPGRSSHSAAARWTRIRAAEVPEFARNADLLEGPDAVRAAPDEGGDPQARVCGAGRGILRFRAGVPDPGGAGRRVLRHGADAAAGPTAAPVHDQGRPQLRPGCGRPGGRGSVVRSAGRGRVRRQRAGAGRGRGSRYLHPAEGGRRYRERLRASRPYLEYLLDQAAAGLDFGHDDGRRQFLGRMLAVAARIPDAAARDQFADRIAHKARITEEVVRAEIRKAAVGRRTDADRAGNCRARAAEKRRKGADLGADSQHGRRPRGPAELEPEAIWSSWPGGNLREWPGACTADHGRTSYLRRSCSV